MLKRGGGSGGSGRREIETKMLLKKGGKVMAGESEEVRKPKNKIYTI